MINPTDLLTVNSSLITNFASIASISIGIFAILYSVRIALNFFKSETVFDRAISYNSNLSGQGYKNQNKFSSTMDYISSIPNQEYKQAEFRELYKNIPDNDPYKPIVKNVGSYQGLKP